MAAIGVAAFDFDGTLSARDSFLPFLLRLRGRRSFGLAMLRAAPSMAVSFGATRDRDLLKEALIGRLLAGYPASRLAAVSDIYAAELAGRLRPSMTDALAWHRQRHHRLVLVSASPEVYLAPLGRQLGFDAVLATRLDVGADGLLTGRLDGANCRGREKEARLRSWLHDTLGDGPIELWAYGDSAGDRELLAMADHPTWVRASRP